MTSAAPSAPAFTAGRQRISIEALEVDAAIGIADWERLERQRLQFDVAVYRDAFGQEQTIADCYDYSALQAYLVGFGARAHIDLLETILAEVLDYCFQDERIVAAEVRLTKPDVFKGVGAPSVSASMMRADWMVNRRA